MEINIQEGSKKSPAVDAALIAKDSFEMKEASLSEDLNTGILYDDKFQVVEIEEKKDDEEPISEVHHQDELRVDSN